MNYDNLVDVKDNELELQETKLKLQRMSDFLTSLNHDLRTPLTAILTMSEVMQHGHAGRVTDDQLKGIEIIKNSASHLIELVDEIHDLTKIESGSIDLKISEVPINPLCESSLQLVMLQAKQKNIELISRIPTHLLSLHADEKRLRQMLVNLLDNAVKFTPESGKVTVEVDRSNISCKQFGKNESAVRFNVTDTGIGIDESEYESVFKPFVQIDTPQNDTSMNCGYTGTGVGLAIVKQFAELHGGNVGVRSEVGKGSCF